MLRWILPLLSVAMLLCPDVHARSTERRLFLAFQGATGCPTREEFTLELERLSPSIVFTPKARSEQALQVQLSRVPQGAVAQIHLDSPGNSEPGSLRELQAATCEEAAQAAAVVIVIALDASSDAGDEAEPSSAPRPSELDASLGGRVLLGPAPNALWVGSAGIALHLARSSPLHLSLGLEVEHSARSNHHTPFGSADFSYRGVRPGVCLTGGILHQLALAGCGVLEVGHLVSKAKTGSDERKTLWLTPGIAAHFNYWVLERVGVGAHGSLGFPLVRDRFLLTPMPIHQPARVSSSAGLRLLLRL